MAKIYRKKGSPYFWAYGYRADGSRWHKSTKVRLGKPRAAQRVADKIEREELFQHRAPPIPLVEALGELKAHKERKGVRPATLDKLYGKGRQLMRVLGVETDIHEITLAHMEAYVDMRLKDEVKRHTIAMEIETLQQALRHLKRHGRYDRDPAAIFPEAVRNAYKPRDRWLPPAEFQKFLDEVPEHRKDHVIGYVYLGGRYSELYKIEGSWVDTKTRELMIDGTKTDDAKRRMPIHPTLWPVIEKRLGLYGDGKLFPDEWNRGVISRTLADACKRAKIEKVVTNDLRRTFCSWLCNAGVPELHAVKLMGHRNSGMIRRVYAQLSGETLRGAIDRLPSVTTVEQEPGKSGGLEGPEGQAESRKTAQLA